MSSKVFMGSFLFLVIFSWFVAELTGTTTLLLSPITLSIGGGLLAIVIAASNTPVVKGLAMVALFIFLGVHFLFSGIDPVILGIVVAPILLTMGLAMSEIGQG